MGVRDMSKGKNGEENEILKNKKMVKKEREGVMELMIIKKKMDWKIWDKGGEWELKDKEMDLGKDG